MKIDNFNFIDFYNPQKRKIKNQNFRELGIGAVSIITPSQCMTRYNQSERNSEGNLIPGIGDHDNNKIIMAGEILGIKNKHDDYTIDEAVEITNFLSEVIILEYSNNAHPCILGYIPSKIIREQIEMVKEISNRLKRLPKEYGKLSIYIETKSGSLKEMMNLNNTIMELEKYVDDNYVFPYEEKNLIDLKNKEELER